MTTNNPNDSVNQWPLLSEEMERTLRRLAWKDENFREALIADPKGIIQQVFPHGFPNGKLPDDLIIKVVEQDASTRHIVLPPLADEVPILEIAEEEQLDLIVNLGDAGKRSRDNYESRLPQESTGERKRSFLEADAKRRDQAKEKEAKAPTEKEIATALVDVLKSKGDKEIHQAAQEALDNGGNINRVVEMLQKKGYLPDRKLPEGVNYIVSQNTDKKWTIVISSSRDDSRALGLPPDLPTEQSEHPYSQGKGCSHEKTVRKCNNTKGSACGTVRPCSK